MPEAPVEPTRRSHAEGPTPDPTTAQEAGRVQGRPKLSTQPHKPTPPHPRSVQLRPGGSIGAVPAGLLREEGFLF